MTSTGPRQQYLRRLWVAEAEAEPDEPLPDEGAHYVTTTEATYSNPNPPRQQEQHVTPTEGPSSPLGIPPITFWTAHRSRIPGGTTHALRRSTEFSTPIELTLDPPSWPGWKA